MTFLELCSRRKSVRRFAKRPVPRQDLVRCLEAARLAPSACNSQPWKFILIDEPGLRDRISEKIFSGLYSMNKFARDASALVAVVSEKVKFLSAVGGQIRDTRYYLIDIGIACEHLILQATELGIASCWIGWFDEKPLKKMLKVPRDKKIDIVIALGYLEGGEPPDRPRKTFSEIAALNAYEQPLERGASLE